ncbi:hypothetical protein NEOLEDRAFT_654297 [Neolentinus lepideus HHB14362 ss-1]|uniref:Uncharacterized protein n=1 Tax=Neolentinus lepideus HHB14362 ss-1 TaxID=1314782 RepID=A0A165QF49_9AGAM|nr:hypothetical protein NEOLEDRAFT_654297 [Neolentinus lepideus HHB14362 ss-1]
MARQPQRGRTRPSSKRSLMLPQPLLPIVLLLSTRSWLWHELSNTTLSVANMKRLSNILTTILPQCETEARVYPTCQLGSG